MLVVILAGGMGTRLAEETDIRPKPMVDIGERPIIWHIMKHYRLHGFKEFFIALGYKGEFIKRYFIDYHIMRCNIRVHGSQGKFDILDGEPEDWVVNLIDTGLTTMTGGRLKRLEKYLKSEPFMLTYGDGISTVNLDKLLAFHKAQGRIATITAVHPSARFGTLDLDGSNVSSFVEKSQTHEGWINGGFMVFEPTVFDYIQGDSTVLESSVLERLAAEGQLAAYQHDGFWQCMDTLRDKRYLEQLWETGKAPWKLW